MAYFGPVMAMALSPKERKARHDALYRNGGALLSIRIRNLAALADWLIETERLKAWDEKNLPAIAAAIDEIIEAQVTRYLADQIDCGSKLETEEPDAR